MKYEIIDFYADWCGPCQMFKPVFEAAPKDFPDITFTKINVDNDQTKAQLYRVKGIPSMVFLQDGEEIYKQVGALSKKDFYNLITNTFKYR
jgi:thioredoxin